MDFLLSLDRVVFLFVNNLLHTPVNHAIALFFSGIGVWGIVWILIGIWLFWRVEKKNRLFFLPLGIGLLGSWFFAEILLKNLIKRARPFVDLSVTVVGGEASGYSFPSSHATTAFAMAVILSNFQPKLRTLFFFLALCVSLSRVYMGVHYPSDIIAGAVVGIGIGSVSLRLVSRVKTKTKKPAKKR